MAVGAVGLQEAIVKIKQAGTEIEKILEVPDLLKEQLMVCLFLGRHRRLNTHTHKKKNHPSKKPPKQKDEENFLLQLRRKFFIAIVYHMLQVACV